jgi:acetolactate synthase-1/3 small subunit
MERTFIVYVANHPGVLNRVSSLFRRRGYNIESLTVGHTQIPDVSRMTVVVGIDSEGALLVEANLYKLVEVLHVEDITSVPSVFRELALVKVAAAHHVRPDLMRIIEAFHARVLEVSPDSLVIETTGPEDAVDSLIEVLRSYGILEMTRTGRVAMTRGDAAPFKPVQEATALPLSQPVRTWTATNFDFITRNCS